MFSRVREFLEERFAGRNVLLQLLHGHAALSAEFETNLKKGATLLQLTPVYDETGKLVQTESYNEGDKAAAGFSPTTSGQYYVMVDLVDGNEASVCLVYSYK